ncbi:hypothetical protein CYY_001376 [Polysphondylium violaceum]|uniref:Dynamin-type G domain-containing protein n=1 Tax=Polysphondylium violaceum TaxID=133409 RepID=A0A8J4V1P0_9MYCE|nr:hypothetical protein CYY_001376 [Polysphondylium violaceum]
MDRIDRQSIAKSTAIPFPINFDNHKYNDMYKAYNKIMILARDLNTQVEIPEFVFIGKEGSGKSTLLESFIGFPMGDSGSNLRPLQLSMINNLSCEKPLITFKRDRFLKNFEVDKVVALGEISGEIQKRNVQSSTPIKIQIEYKYCLNMHLIEPTSIVTTQPNRKISVEDLDETLLSYTKPTNSLLVFVEAAIEPENIEMLDLAKKLDPKLDRSIFVFNKFSEFLAKGTFATPRDLNRYLGIPNLDAPTFFTTLPNNEQRLKCTNKEELTTACDELQAKDIENLEHMQFDKRYERNIGLTSLRHYLSELTWRRYQETVPEVLKRLRGFKKNSEEQLAKLKQQLDGMNAGKLRVIASNYVMEFLQGIEKLIVGTLEGNPNLNGQTLVEEKAQDETGEWYDGNHRPIYFDERTWNVQYHDSKLYGGQQFERLLSEFKAVTENIELGELSADEVASSIGSNKPTNVSVLAWAASDLAQKKTKEVLLPLVDQLFKREIYILRRLVDIVDRMIENKKKASFRRQASSPMFESSPLTLGLRANGMGERTGSPATSSINGSGGIGNNANDSLVNIEDHPYFTHSIKEMYFRFIDQVVQSCKNKCMDEFYTTKLIHWDLQNNAELKHLVDQTNKTHISSGKDTHQIVSTLATKLFQEMRTRITKNIMLKCYNFFLIPMQNELWREVQGKITVLSDSMLEELFEVSITKEGLKEDERHLITVVNQFQQQEENFLLAANQFTHPTN